MSRLLMAGYFVFAAAFISNVAAEFIWQLPSSAFTWINLALLSGYLLTLQRARRMSKRWAAEAQEMVQRVGRTAVGSLVEGLTMPYQSEVARDLLGTMLPRIRADDTVLLNTEQRSILNGVLGRMGRETACAGWYEAKASKGTLHDETDYLPRRGDIRLLIHVARMTSVTSLDSRVVIVFYGGHVAFELGGWADPWEQAICESKKRGHKPGSRISLQDLQRNNLATRERRGPPDRGSDTFIVPYGDVESDDMADMVGGAAVAAVVPRALLARLLAPA